MWKLRNPDAVLSEGNAMQMHLWPETRQDGFLYAQTGVDSCARTWSFSQHTGFATTTSRTKNCYTACLLASSLRHSLLRQCVVHTCRAQQASGQSSIDNDNR